MCDDYKIPHYFDHNGLEKPKYLSVRCKGCEHSSYLWFEKSGPEDPDQVTLTFKRPPYGINMHKELRRHLPKNLKSLLTKKRGPTKSK